MISAGDLRERISIEAPPAGVDALGQRLVAGAWTPVCTVWAQAQPLRGREFFAAGQMQSEAVVRFRLRWRAGITGAMRVRWRGVAHAIVGEPIDVAGARTVLELMCAAGVRDGR